jgi:hypothetical protein
MQGPMPGEGQQPPKGAEGGGGGGGMAEMLQKTAEGVAGVAQAVGQLEQVPDELKQFFGQADEFFKRGLEGLLELTGGGEGKPAPSEPVTPEQGASGAVPVSPAGVARGR